MASRRNDKSKLNIVRVGIFALVVIFLIVMAVIFLQLDKVVPEVINGINGGNGEIPFEHYNETENETEVTENESEICDNECLYAKAVAEKNLEYCEWMNNETLEQECYVAIANDSTDACLRVLAVGVMEKCIIENANRTGELTICDNLNPEKAVECKVIFEPCYEYVDTELRICLALKYDDPDYCELDDDCLLNYSITVADKAICNDITGMAEKTACISVHEEQDNCINLESTAEREYCWELYAIISNNRLICTQIISEGQYAVECYSYFAVKTNDLTFCNADNIELDDRWDCYTAFTLGTGNVSGCDGINRLASTHMFNCYFEYGKKYGNPQACEMMDDPRLASTCYVGVIMNNTNLDWRYCGGVAVEDWRNKCYTQTAQIEEDISICDFIVEELKRQICTDSYHTFINGKSD